MSIRRLTASVVAVVTLSLCAGCSLFAPDDLDDVARVSTFIFDQSEATFPAIAKDLGATIVRAGSWFESRGGAEGTNVRLNFQVNASLTGPSPTVDQVKSALTDAGYLDVTSTPDAQGVYVQGTTADGAATVGIDFSDDPEWGIDYEMYLISEEELTISSSDRETYRYQDHRGFDQSLVTPLDE